MSRLPVNSNGNRTDQCVPPALPIGKFCTCPLSFSLHTHTQQTAGGAQDLLLCMTVCLCLFGDCPFVHVAMQLFHAHLTPSIRFAFRLFERTNRYIDTRLVDTHFQLQLQIQTQLQIHLNMYTYVLEKYYRLTYTVCQPGHVCPPSFTRPVCICTFLCIYLYLSDAQGNWFIFQYGSRSN